MGNLMIQLQTLDKHQSCVVNTFLSESTFLSLHRGTSQKSSQKLFKTMLSI